MFELGRDSDGDLSLGTANSSSMSSESCSSFGRSSFDAAAATVMLEPPTSSASKTGNKNGCLTSKPHRSSESAYSDIRNAGNGGLTLRDFRLVRRVGSGDIGTVYLCRLKNPGGGEDAEEEDAEDEKCGDRRWMYAMKVVDKEALAAKKKVHRAEMERKVLKMLDHPFLPSLYAEFEASHFSCFVMEYCSGGDLHSLRHKQPNKRFSLNSARFYAAEVLVALEYLHMLGIIYRDLKPENVLVRSDGHIMLSDFDLSLCSDSIAAVESPGSSSPHTRTPPYTRARSPKTSFSPFSCLPLPGRLFRSRRVQTSSSASAGTASTSSCSSSSASNRLFVAEPVAARSCSFVGTHEYVSPEVASGGSHGNAVDWWAYGVFLYEMVYGRTPFAAQSNEATLMNIVKKPLSFPTPTPRSALEHHARDLISGLLEKDPTRRLGSKRGSAEVKCHPFFKGVNLALIRCSTPPEIPSSTRRQKTTSAARKNIAGSQSTAFDFF